MMRDWYLRQSPRDRMIVLALAALIVISALYALLWYPLSNRIATAQANIESKEQTLEYVREGAARLRGGGGSQIETKQSDKDPYLLINEVIVAKGLTPPERLEPSGSDGARVQYSEVAFDQLVQVIGELELYGLKVSTLNIGRKNESPGMVSARFIMERAG